MNYLTIPVWWAYHMTKIDCFSELQLVQISTCLKRGVNWQRWNFPSVTPDDRPSSGIECRRCIQSEPEYAALWSAGPLEGGQWLDQGMASWVGRLPIPPEQPRQGLQESQLWSPGTYGSWSGLRHISTMPFYATHSLNTHSKMLFTHL